MDIKEVMRRQYGPMPVWAWTALFASFVAGVVVFRKRVTPKSDTSGNGAGNGSPVGEFNSGQSTTTTDANGNQITTQYNASGPLTGFPGYLTNQAGPMPYSGGDVYVNYPVSTNAAPPPPAQQTQTMRQLLDTGHFNAQTAGGVPFTMMVTLPGETWKDVAARAWGYADNFSQLTDPATKDKVTRLANYMQQTNNTPGSTGNGPAPGQIVLFH